MQAAIAHAAVANLEAEPTNTANIRDNPRLLHQQDQQFLQMLRRI
jgi:hypothetical protein